MTDYQSILAISVLHEYYNADSDGFAPVDLLPDRETALLLRQYGMILRSARGFVRLIVDSERFSDVAELTDEFTLRLFLFSTDPALRSITETPHPFDISVINAEFTDSPTLDINAEGWVDINQLGATTAGDSVTLYNTNLISILTVTLSKRHLTLEKKSITVRFQTISVRWKYYILSLNDKKNLNIPHGFTEQEREQVASKTARIFLSNNPIPLRKTYTESFSLRDANNVMIKSLPLPAPDNISTFIDEGIKKSVAHIYVN